jgi:hypothetical protein
MIKQSVEDRFEAIVTKHRLTRSAVKDLAINLLVSLGHNIHTEARTICKTPRTNINSDSFQHFKHYQRVFFFTILYIFLWYIF